MISHFSEAYYRQGNYREYLTRKFDALASELVTMTHHFKESTIVDFGCGYGGLLDAFFRSGFTDVYGTDISQWAIEEGHRRFPHLMMRIQFYNRDMLRRKSYLLTMLDVLEHMPEYEIESVLKLARQGCVGSLVVRIPVSAVEGDPYVLPVSNNDPTHICCHPKAWWNNKLSTAGFTHHLDCDGATIFDSPGVLAAIYH